MTTSKSKGSNPALEKIKRPKSKSDLEFGQLLYHVDVNVRYLNITPVIVEGITRRGILYNAKEYNYPHLYYSPKDVAKAIEIHLPDTNIAKTKSTSWVN